MNYAIPGASMGRFQDFYRQRLAALPEASRQTFNVSPETGYEYWMSFLNPSLSQDDTLRRIYTSLLSRFYADAASRGAEGSHMKFDDYLGNLDVDRELARLTPQRRGEEPRRFGTSARFVSF